MDFFKRIFDVIFSALGLIVMSPVLGACLILIWLQDFHSPLYVAQRAGLKGKPFRMVKLRSMIVNADKAGIDSTANSDRRITWIGCIIRKYKLDEFSQLWNVLKGDMSFVGPRPNVLREVALYTEKERGLLDVRPGITDFASIVFSDEGDILAGSEDPDLKYHQVIRPWKSRLGLYYVNNRNLFLDIQIIMLTVLAILSRRRALQRLQKILIKLGADQELVNVSSRTESLKPFPPPGSRHIVVCRGKNY